MRSSRRANLMRAGDRLSVCPRGFRGAGWSFSFLGVLVRVVRSRVCLGVLLASILTAAGPAYAVQRVVVEGTQGDDVILATGADEVIYPKAGDDVVRAAGGSDQVVDKAGDDVVFGGPGSDGILAQLGHDVIHGGAGDDNIRLQGHDTAYGGPDDDQIDAVTNGSGAMYGGDGDDDLYVSVVHGDWTVRGGPGNDVLHSENQEAVRYHGGTGDDEITYAGGPGKAFGGEGDDMLTAYFTSTASLHGGPGDDQIDATNYGYERPNPVVCGDGSDTVYLDPTDPVNPDCEAVFVNFLGTEGDDDIDGTPYDDVVSAYQGGADTITTHGGNDR